MDSLNSVPRTGANQSDFPSSYKLHEQAEHNKLPQHSQVKLESILKQSLSGFSPVNGVSTIDYSPEAVTNRVLDFVSGYISQNAGNGSAAQTMIQQAKQGVAQGIAEAREILGSAGELSEDISVQIKQTGALINQGLDDLSNTVEFADAPAQLSSPGRLISSSGTISSQYKQSSQAAIEIITQDGDKVSLSYSALIQSSSSQHYNHNAQQSSYSANFQSSSSINFQFSVEGELDVAEQRAIDNLLNDIGQLAGQFFQGDVQAAFKSALELGFDGAELKSLAVDLQQNTQAQLAETYRRTEQLAAPVETLLQNIAANPAASPASSPGPAIDVLSQLGQLLDQVKNTSLIEKPDHTIKSLLSDMFEVLEDEFEFPIKSYLEDLVAEF